MKRKLLLFVLLMMVTLVVFVLATGTRAEIRGRRGSNWVLSKGSAHGVKTGMTGYFWTLVRSGGKDYETNIAKFKVIKVNRTTCQATVTDKSFGFSEKDFRWVTFMTRLQPQAKPKPKAKAMPKPKRFKDSILSGKSITWYLEKGDESFDKGEYGKAQKYYEKVLKIDSEDPVAKDKIAVCVRMLSLSENEKKYQGYISRGDEYLKKGEVEYALKYYLAAYKAMAEKEEEVAGRFKEISGKHQSEWRQFENENATDLKLILEKYFVIDRTGFSSQKLGMEWVKVEAGAFTMGSEKSSNEKPVHKVYLDTYYISKYEVTFDQYDAFCEATGRSKPSDSGWGRGSRPVINVSWDDAVAFCRWLSSKTGKTIRLPTEAEWEKAAKGGTDGRGYTYSGSNDLNSVGWYNANSGEKILRNLPDPSELKSRKEWKHYFKRLVDNKCWIHPVGGKAANELGIYDMSGNVWEWCLDWYDKNYYSRSPSRNPTGPSSGSNRVLRGGSWSYFADSCRSAFRNYNYPSYRNFHLGFRPVMEP